MGGSGWEVGWQGDQHGDHRVGYPGLESHGEKMKRSGGGGVKQSTPQECCQANHVAVPNDSSTVEQVDGAAAALREATRWCTRSKRRWTGDLQKLREELEVAKRGPAGIG